MERKRVVHYAKTRTARVLSPAPRTHSPSSLSSEGFTQAPLASIDSDIFVVTKQRDGTNTAPNLRIPTRRPPSRASVSSVPNTEVQPAWQEQKTPTSTLPEQRTHTPPRQEQKTYISTWQGNKPHTSTPQQQRARTLPKQDNNVSPAQNRTWPRNGEQRANDSGPTGSADTRDRRWQPSPSRPRLSQRPSSTQSSPVKSETSSIPVQSVNKSLPPRSSNRFDTQDAAGNSYRHGSRFGYQERAAANETERPPAGVTSKRRNTDDYSRQTVVTSSPKSASKSKNVFPSSRLPRSSTPDSSLSDRKTSESKPRLSNSPVPKQIPVSNSRSQGSPSSKHESQATRAGSPRFKLLQEPCRVIKRPSDCHKESTGANLSQGVTLQTRQSFQPYRNIDNGSTPSPHVRNIDNESTPSPQVSAGEKCDDLNTRSIPRYFGSGNVKKYQNKFDSLPTSVNMSKQQASNADQRISSQRARAQPSQNTATVVTHKTAHPSDENIGAGTIHQSSPSNDRENDPNDASYFRSARQRASLRLATQGYDSMSDLTDSVECLRLGPAERNARDAESTVQSRSCRNDAYSEVKRAQTPSTPTPQMTTTFESQRHGYEHTKPKAELGFTSQRDNKHSEDNFRASECNTSTSRVFDKRLAQDVGNSVKRNSFKLATSSIADVWLLEEDMQKFVASMNEIEVNDHDVSDPQKQNVGHHGTAYSEDKNSVHEPDLDTLSPLNDTRGQQQIGTSRTESEERLSTLKRRSYILATSSISDLTCDIDDSEPNRRSPHVNNDMSGQSQRSDTRTGSSNSSSLGTPDSRAGRSRGGSFSSNRLNSSYGSFYSCQSAELGKSKSSPNTGFDDSGKRRRYSGNRTRDTGNDTLDSVEYNGSMSEDTSMYYTASNASFASPDDVTSNGSRSSENKQRSPKIPRLQWWRKSPYPLENGSPRNIRANVRDVNKANSLPAKGKAPNKGSSPLNNVFQCYGCGVTRYPAHDQRIENRGRGMVRGNGPSSPKQEKMDNDRRRDNEDRQRSYSTPPLRFHNRYSNPSPRNQPIQRQISPDPEPQQIMDQSFTSSIHTSASTSSLNSLESETWQDTPYGPPALGRPRRKLYAGFDSQPLPMDSFLSDSSSVYSGVSNSSWTTSKSADTGGSSAMYDNEPLTPNARAVSSIAPGMTTPTQRTSGDNVFNYFNYTDKRPLSCENNHNFYKSTENPFVDSCMKDGFHDKTFSKESLISFQSDVTYTDADRCDSKDIPQDFRKSPDFSAQDGSAMLNNASFVGHDKRTNEFAQIDSVNNNSRSDLNSLLSNGSGYFTGVNSQVTNENQGRMFKAASSSTSAPRARFPPKRKYFSSKDILDLLMTSEKNAVGGATSLTSLEKQAQKMCKVILCCNEMDGARVVGKEYHF